MVCNNLDLEFGYHICISSEINAVRWPGKLLSTIALEKPSPSVKRWALTAKHISPGPRGSSNGLYQSDWQSNLKLSQTQGLEIKYIRC